MYSQEDERLKLLGVNPTNKHSGMTEDQAAGAKDPVQVILCDFT